MFITSLSNLMKCMRQDWEEIEQCCRYEMFSLLRAVLSSTGGYVTPLYLSAKHCIYWQHWGICPFYSRHIFPQETEVRVLLYLHLPCIIGQLGREFFKVSYFISTVFKELDEQLDVQLVVSASLIDPSKHQ